ncbi:MAG: hypothetical protein LBL72_06235 [Candidatus Accumulibacter sp.]|jgi:hypothetical protein|nr:hypothetical protein [Accumulibacter sp.]
MAHENRTYRTRRATRNVVASGLLAGVLASLFLLGAGRVAGDGENLKEAAPIVVPASVAERLIEGDLIFRIGHGWQSEAVRGVDRSSAGEKRGDPYSHIGMLLGAPGRWRVLHAVPAEIPGRENAVVIDPLDFFLAPARNRGIAIYRVEASDASRAAAARYALQRLGTPFRVVEDDKEGQYCTTLIWYAWQRAGVDLGARFEHLSVPLASGLYLLPHSLRTAKALRVIYVSGIR